MPNFAATCDENPLKYTRTVLYNVLTFRNINRRINI